MPKRFTQNEFNERLRNKHDDIITNDPYVNSYTKMHFFHKKCGYEWDTIPTVILRHGCPKCGKAILKSHDTFVNEVETKYPHLHVTGQYVKSSIKVEVTSSICNHSWQTLPTNLLRGHMNCPICTGRKVQVGFNDFNSCHPELVKYLLNTKDGEKYTAQSHSKVGCKCPDCGYEKNMILKSLVTQGFCCDRCKDRISYPNKFLRKFIAQLPVDNVIFEYCPIWSNSRKYDCYFEYNNQSYVVEMDGGFHYEGNRMNHTSVDKIQENDLIKDKLAELHNLIMIRIECKQSEQDYITIRIKQSLFNDLFNLQLVDWNKCGEYAVSNLIKDVCEYFEKYKNIYFKYEIANHFQISSGTLSDYLRKGHQYGWCDNSQQRYIHKMK